MNHLLELIHSGLDWAIVGAVVLTVLFATFYILMGIKNLVVWFCCECMDYVEDLLDARREYYHYMTWLPAMQRAYLSKTLSDIRERNTRVVD